MVRGLGREQFLYFTAKLTGQVAQNLLLAALFVIAGTSSNSAIGLSSIFVATIVPAMVLGLFGGALVDRMGPARGWALGALLRCSAVLLGLIFLQSPTAAWMIAFLYSAVSQVHTPAEMALVRTISAGAPGRVHSLLVALQYAGQGVGMLVLAPALYYFGGSNAILVGSVVGFLVVAVIALALLPGLESRAGPSIEPARGIFDFRSTVRFFATQPLARDAMAVLSVKGIVSQGIIVALPLYLSRDMGLGREAAIFLLVPGIAGVLAGLAWAGSAVTLERSGAVMRWGLGGMIVSVFALAALDYGLSTAFTYSQIPPIVRMEATMNTTFAVAIPVAFLVGLSLTLALVAARVALTEAAPVGQQARVFAAQGTITDAVIVLPLLLMGVGVQFAGARPSLAAIGVLSTFVFLAMQHPRFARRDLPIPDAEAAPAPV